MKLPTADHYITYSVDVIFSPCTVMHLIIYLCTHQPSTNLNLLSLNVLANVVANVADYFHRKKVVPAAGDIVMEDTNIDK